jgi:hypothetical protein
MSIRARLKRTIQEAVHKILAPTLAEIQEDLLRLKMAQTDLVKGNPLLMQAGQYFSQNDEDGILLEILRRIGIENGHFCEFGVGDGTENNTIVLLANGWSGAWIGGEDIAFDPGQSRLSFVKAWVTCENAASLALRALRSLPPEKVNVLSLDLDGNDSSIVRALFENGFAPDVCIVEYNAKFGPDIEFEMPYSNDHTWVGGDFMGASLLSWVKLFEQENYTLVACNMTGVNAFFIRPDHADKFKDAPRNIAELYRAYQAPRGAGLSRTNPKTVHHLATRSHYAATGKPTGTLPLGGNQTSG